MLAIGAPIICARLGHPSHTANTVKAYPTALIVVHHLKDGERSLLAMSCQKRKKPTIAALIVGIASVSDLPIRCAEFVRLDGSLFSCHELGGGSDPSSYQITPSAESLSLLHTPTPDLRAYETYCASLSGTPLPSPRLSFCLSKAQRPQRYKKA